MADPLLKATEEPVSLPLLCQNLCVATEHAVQSYQLRSTCSGHTQHRAQYSEPPAQGTWLLKLEGGEKKQSFLFRGTCGGTEEKQLWKWSAMILIALT